MSIPNLTPEPWMDNALCAQTDPEAFFPEKGESARPARLICHRCAVQGACREYAIEQGFRHGIWGGMSDRERTTLQRARKRASQRRHEQKKKAS